MLAPILPELRERDVVDFAAEKMFRAPAAKSVATNLARHRLDDFEYEDAVAERWFENPHLWRQVKLLNDRRGRRARSEKLPELPLPFARQSCDAHSRCPFAHDN
jgi:hypothetical protein